MNRLIINNILRGLGLIFFQIIVLNNIYLGGYVTPFLYILFILMLPTSTNKSLLVFLSFLSGLLVDIFCNSLGFHAFAATLIGFFRILFADKILTKDDNADFDAPSIQTVPVGKYITFSAILVFTYCLTYYTIETFNFDNSSKLFIQTVLSSISTWILVVGCQLIFIKKKGKGLK